MRQAQTDASNANTSSSFQITVTNPVGGATLSFTDTSAAPGTAFDVPVVLSSGGSSVAGFQADVTFDPQLLTFNSARKGDPVSAAGKDLTTQPQGSGVVRMSVAGLNQNVVADGTIAFMNFTLAGTATGTSRAVLACSASQAVSPLAQAVTLSCRSGAVTAGGCTCDVNKDGVVTVADVQLMINMALGLTADKCDLNGDGQVNIADVQIVINAALGLGCSGH